MKKEALFSLLLMFIIISCNNSDPEPQIESDEVFLTLTIGDEFLDSNSEHYIILTDSGNELLGYSSIGNGNSYTFERAESMLNQSYDYHILTVFRNSSASRFRMNTTRNSSSRELTWEKASNTSGDFGSSLGNANFDFINVPNHDLFNLMPPNVNTTGTQLSNGYSDITLFQNIQDYYVYLRNGQVGLFKEGTLVPGEQTLDLSDMSSEMDLYRIQVPGDVSVLAVSANDSRYNNISRPYFLHFGVFTDSENLSDISFHLPKERSHLSNYFTFLDVAGDNGLSYRSTASSVSDVLLPELLEATIIVNNLQVDNMSINTTGVFDLLDVNISSGDFFWNLTTDDPSIRFDLFPTLPSEIINLVPEFSKDAFASVESSFVKLSKTVQSSGSLIFQSVQK